MEQKVTVEEILKMLPEEHTFCIDRPQRDYPMYAIGENDHVLNRGSKLEKVFPALPRDKVASKDFACAVVKGITAASPRHIIITI